MLCLPSLPRCSKIRGYNAAFVSLMSPYYQITKRDYRGLQAAYRTSVISPRLCAYSAI
nr:MAG TPA: hypothetical protein [Siphoviridae sp. ctHdl3]